MPRNSKSKRRAAAAAPPTPAPVPQPPASTKSKGDTLFRLYANRSSNTIEPEGIEALCKDLRLEVTDVRILILAWKMEAEKMGYFSLKEWQKGLKSLKADTIDKLKKALSGLEKTLMNPEVQNLMELKKSKSENTTLSDSEEEDEIVQRDEYEIFHEYAFQYLLTEERQKSVDINTVCELLNLVLGPRYRAQVALLTKYLMVQTENKALTMDQWVQFRRFCKEIQFPGLENYDSEEAWPCIIDDFVDWVKLEGQ